MTKAIKGRRLGAILGGTLLLGLSFFSPGSSAAAATGGCNPHIKVNGWDVGVCISDRGTSSPRRVFPDVYLNQVGSVPSNCTMYIELWSDDGLELARDDGHPCVARQASYQYTSGGGLVSLNIDQCYRGLHTHAFYYIGSTVHIGDSPHIDYGC
ncbi:hypothetical protein GCM10023196_082290 [Actinoallomurus vinaceus]|uniref:Secreted protein n=1 Tax=Actinoallomurus vinaceus TaxID=1080074 RepID=A0ABP8UME9_9ACTN